MKRLTDYDWYKDTANWEVGIRGLGVNNKGKIVTAFLFMQSNCFILKSVLLLIPLFFYLMIWNKKGNSIKWCVLPLE